MDILIQILRRRGLKLPKFLLWKIAQLADLELEYSVELAEYFYGENAPRFGFLRGARIGRHYIHALPNLRKFKSEILDAGDGYLTRVYFERLGDSYEKAYGLEAIALTGSVEDIKIYIGGLKTVHQITDIGALMKQQEALEYLYNEGLTYRSERLFRYPQCKFLHRVREKAFGLTNGVLSGDIAHIRYLVSIGCNDFETAILEAHAHHLQNIVDFLTEFA